MKEINLKKISSQIRLDILNAIFHTKSSHIGSCLSIVEILTVLYFKIMRIDPKNSKDKNRDIFILSKGHAAVALYATLAEAGFCNKEILLKYTENGTKLAGHVIKDSLPGIENSSGSLGHGLPIISGMALASKLENKSNEFFCLMGDGECNEGSVWESAMFCAQNNLNNITAIVDFNNQQGMGVAEKIIDQNNLKDRWRSFGWDAYEVDGHNIDDLISVFKKDSGIKPKVIIARTVKGKGISYMENNVEWHYKNPNQEQYDLAVKELEI